MNISNTVTGYRLITKHLANFRSDVYGRSDCWILGDYGNIAGIGGLEEFEY